jgi:hypothetical protein
LTFESECNNLVVSRSLVDFDFQPASRLCVNQKKVACFVVSNPNNDGKVCLALTFTSGHQRKSTQQQSGLFRRQQSEQRRQGLFGFDFHFGSSSQIKTTTKWRQQLIWISKHLSDFYY